MLASLKFVERFLSLPCKDISMIVNGRSLTRRAYDLDVIAPMLTRQGFEVDAIAHRGEGFDMVVVGVVREAKAHPKADRLQVCQVDVGEGTPRQIVCGAKNARPGLYVAVALPGARLPADLNIKSSSIRDVESHGMLCSRAELGLPVNADVDGDGIWELNVDAQGGLEGQALNAALGVPVFDALGLRDVLLELNVTPNRPDMLCHEGVAREIAAGLAHAALPYERRAASFQKGAGTTLDALVGEVAAHAQVKTASGTFSVDNELGVSAFFVALDNVSVGPSPAWLRNLLESLGQNAINGIVDASNYVLLAHGQPSHAFDLDKLAAYAGHDGQEKKLILRPARAGEAFTGLDGKGRTLVAQDMVVADASEPQALLGVLGGEHSKVDAATKTIVIEFANAHPVAVRRTSRRHGRRTDSSFAFEKGIDTAARFHAALEVMGLAQSLCGDKLKFLGGLHSKLLERGEAARAFVNDADLSRTLGPASVMKACVDFSVGCVVPSLKALAASDWKAFFEAKRKSVTLSYKASDEETIVGAKLNPFEVQLRILQSLGFEVAPQGADAAQVSVPHWRWLDVAEMPDLVEEVVRVVGIDRVPSAPLVGTGVAGKDDDHLAPFERAAARAAALGYNEISGFHFMRADDLARLGLPTPTALGEPLAMINPIIKDEPLLHCSLIPNLLRRVTRNLSYGVRRGQLFHVSRTFQNRDALGARVFVENGSDVGLAADLAIPHGTLFEYSSAAGLAYTREATQAGRPVETPRLAGVAFGAKHEKSWQNGGEVSWDLLDVLAHGVEIARGVGAVAKVVPLPESHPMAPALHPGRRAAWCVELDGTETIVGWAGAFHPAVLRGFEIEGACLGFELNLALLRLGQLQGGAVRKRVVSALRFPTVSRDFAFMLAEDVSAKSVEDTVRGALSGSLLGSVAAKLLGVRIFDVYRGKGVPEGHKSVAFNVTLEPLERTLTDADISKVRDAVVEAIAKELKADLRG